MGGEGLDRCHSGHWGWTTDSVTPGYFERPQHFLQEDPFEKLETTKPGDLPEGLPSPRVGAPTGVDVLGGGGDLQGPAGLCSCTGPRARLPGDGGHLWGSQ